MKTNNKYIFFSRGLKLAFCFTKLEFVCGVIVLLIVGGCESGIDYEPYVKDDNLTISDTIQSEKEKFSKTWEIINECNLRSTLSAYNPTGNGYTLFMPTNRAFDNFIAKSEQYNSFDDLLADKNFSNLLIRYHLVNGSYASKDFPFGSLPDTTFTGDFLTIGFLESEDSITYMINGDAPVVKSDIELINGYIHVIDELLIPITYSSYDWIESNEGFSIFRQALEMTGLKDAMGIYKNVNGELRSNYYTLLAVPDSIYAKNEINNIDDIIIHYNKSNLDFTDEESEFYQNIGFHIIKDRAYFLDYFEGSENFNTFSNFPIQISAGIEIKVSPGKDTLDMIIDGQDTTFINYARIMMNNSNITTKNGAIHLLEDMLEIKTPSRTLKTFQFFEDEYINSLSQEAGIHILNQGMTDKITWTGSETIMYVKSGTSISASNNDYLLIGGNFQINYKIPELLPGKYEILIRAERGSAQHATLQISLDGKRIGSSVDLSDGNSSFRTTKVGTIDLLEYTTHEIYIKSLIPGTFTWDFIQFQPI